MAEATALPSRPRHLRTARVLACRRVSRAGPFGHAIPRPARSCRAAHAGHAPRPPRALAGFRQISIFSARFTMLPSAGHLRPHTRMTRDMHAELFLEAPDDDVFDCFYFTFHTSARESRSARQRRRARTSIFATARASLPRPPERRRCSPPKGFCWPTWPTGL